MTENAPRSWPTEGCRTPYCEVQKEGALFRSKQIEKRAENVVVWPLSMNEQDKESEHCKSARLRAEEDKEREENPKEFTEM